MGRQIRTAALVSAVILLLPSCTQVQPQAPAPGPRAQPSPAEAGATTPKPEKGAPDSKSTLWIWASESVPGPVTLPFLAPPQPSGPTHQSVSLEPGTVVQGQAPLYVRGRVGEGLHDDGPALPPLDDDQQPVLLGLELRPGLGPATQVVSARVELATPNRLGWFSPSLDLTLGCPDPCPDETEGEVQAVVHWAVVRGWQGGQTAWVVRGPAD